MREVGRVREALSPGLVTALEEEAVPVVIEGAADDWPAARWGRAELLDRLGPAEIAYKRSATHQHPNFHASSLGETFARGTSTFAEFLGGITSGPVEARARTLFTGDEQYALRRRDGVTEISPIFAPLLEGVHFEGAIPADRLYTMWAWFSGPGVRTWLHYDNNGCHNLNAQLAGEKSCVLYAPRDLWRTYPFPLGGGNPAYNCCRVDVDAVDTAAFPAFAEAEAWQTRLGTGDLLFVPAWWIHAFAHHGELNVNVNCWWKPEHPPANVVAARQALVNAAAAAGLVAPPGSPEAEVLARLESALIRANLD